LRGYYDITNAQQAAQKNIPRNQFNLSHKEWLFLSKKDPKCLFFKWGHCQI